MQAARELAAGAVSPDVEAHMTSPTDASGAQNFAEAINQADTEGWNQAMGLVFQIATADEVVASWTVAAHHRQPYGISRPDQG